MEIRFVKESDGEILYQLLKKLEVDMGCLVHCGRGLSWKTGGKKII